MYRVYYILINNKFNYNKYTRTGTVHQYTKALRTKNYIDYDCSEDESRSKFAESHDMENFKIISINKLTEKIVDPDYIERREMKDARRRGIQRDIRQGRLRRL